jgi:hypothetical protein
MEYKLSLNYKKLIFLFTLISASAANADVNKFRAIHNLYFGGFIFLETVTEFYSNKSYYKTITKSSTKGALNLVFDWKGVVNSTGKINKTRLLPQNYQSLGRWGEEIWITKLTYNQIGQITSTKVSPLPDVEEIIPLPLNPELGAIDPLSFISQVVIKATTGKSCKEEVAVFDGRRRYKLKIEEMGVEKLSKTPYNIFEGTALACKLEYIPLGGQRRRTFEQENPRKEGVIYLARPSPVTPVIPVSFSFETSFGTLVGHLVKIDPLGSSFE